MTLYHIAILLAIGWGFWFRKQAKIRAERTEERPKLKVIRGFRKFGVR